MLRVSSQRAYNTKNVRYYESYNEDAQYTAFMDALFDENNCLEAIDAVSAVSLYIKNKYLLRSQKNT